jgi:enoyl-CoA hydratase/carnithine racemase
VFEISWEDAGAIACVELRRPPANAIGLDQIRELAVVLTTLQEKQACRAILFHSNGRFFSAGGDIKFMAEVARYPDAAERLMGLSAEMQQTFGELEELKIPTVAAVSGIATGGGLELALSCDMRVADKSARVGLPEVRIGLLPGAGGTQRVTRLAGAAVAKRLILTGEIIEAEEAARLGLVSEVVPDGRSYVRALELCRQLSALPRRALAAIKRCISLAPSRGGLAAELEETLELQRDPETKTLIKSFVERSR